tara:strand:+ start:109 stop:522 length:414 start_codon:yes stop_codon:yes gene_type:complete
MRKYNTLSDSVAIDVTTIGTGDPLNALETVQDFILDYRANTDGVSDADQMAYLAFVQDLADDVRKTQEEADLRAFLDDKEREVAEGTECRNWDSSEECRDDSCLHHEILDYLDKWVPECDCLDYRVPGNDLFCEKCI